MTNTLEYILDKYSVDRDQRPPIIIGGDHMMRRELCKLFRELDFKLGVELGVEQGLHARLLCTENPQAHIIGIDAWQAYNGYRDHVSQEKMDRLYFKAVERLAPFKNIELRREYSMDAVEYFEDGELDFVYIDGNHEFLYIAQDVAKWSKKVRSGGIVSGHDYKRLRGNYKCHVKDVVQAFMYSHDIKPWFVTVNKSPNWFYVKADGA